MGSIASSARKFAGKVFDSPGRVYDEFERSAESAARSVKSSVIPQMPEIPKPPKPPAIAASQSASVGTATANTARAQQDALDAQRRKRGLASNVYTGREGVGATPVGTRTLVGS